jgi:hypothetical protein
MTPPQKKLSIPTAITVVAVAVIALIASGVLRPTPATGVTPTPSPSAPASPAPASPVPATPAPATPVPATPAPATPVPTEEPAPADDFSDGVKSVRLDIATPHHIVAEVKDSTGRVSDANSGRAGDGMSVRWGEVKVENVDEDTLRLTWVGLPNDDPVKIAVFDEVRSATDVRPTIVVMQLMPYENTDAVGFDRVLDLDFYDPVLAGDYATVLQDGWDTEG